MSKTTAVYLGLGSNLGDRKANIEEALRLLDGLLGPRTRQSSLLETPAWGFEGEDFLNAAVRYDIILPADADLKTAAYHLLENVKKIERSLGRKGAAEYDSEGVRIYHSRTIDIDILYFGDLVMDEPLLTIPHKGIKQRDFVKIPLSEIID